ncbi:prenyltransferase [Nocardioides dokdonensis FR1436]|uniref:Prenyltransferase n=1 Tax=Nocardioides dokdonensis FR1436 TaxID=1300347 RepID=A0A1A9GPF2_9ACTN|nr:UbiA family prenyltransferase [Nocardioides dokdonensis]ANH40179.1 prenyltransferase [Nocardioides dokdonensis FR1436]
MWQRTGALLGAAHPGPALAVTVLAGLLALPADLQAGTAALVVAAVLTGQLSIGWSNDLIDVRRDRAVGRTDKPLATGELPLRLVQWCCGAALATTIVLSLAVGLPAGLAHLLLVAAGWAYNLGLKSTLLSWLPYAVAFGGLPAFVWLAGALDPPLWGVGAGALLGVGAHLLNVLPDLEDDARTGVRGLPHRLGPRLVPVVAVAVLVTASAVIAAGAPDLRGWVLALGALLVVGLAAVALVRSGRDAFRAAVGIALVDVVLLVVAG